MTNTPLKPSQITCENDLVTLWRSLMGPGGFGQRSLWLLMLDSDDTPLPVIVPIDGIPDRPDPSGITGLGALVSHLAGDQQGGSVAMLLSRPGSATITAADREWAQALLALSPTEGRRWPVALATRDKVQVFAPDDLIS